VRAALLRVDHLTVAFGGVRAVDDVSLRIAEGEEVALIGPNGAGKSTLFAAVAGQQAPTAGRVFVAGADVTRWPVHRRAAAGVARTFQMARPLPTFTVAEQLALAGGGVASDDLLERLGLGPFAAETPAALPYGALRALEVGLALAARPRLLLLDEPTAGMAPADAAALCTLLAELHDERDLTLLLVEHDMAVVGQLARRVVVLDRGRVIADGEPAGVAVDPAVVASYLGTTADRLTEGVGAQR
jgi:ABC-type branched-subunit amino acid transport system ATPase component